MEILERVLVSSRHEEPDMVPVVLQPYSMVFKSYGRIFEMDFYNDIKAQLETKIAFQKRFPDVYLVPRSTLPEGCGVSVLGIPLAFRAKVKWNEDSPPDVIEYPIKEPEDIDKLVSAGCPEVNEVSTASEYLERLKYFWDWFPKEMKENYGYIDGNIFAFMPIDGVSLCMGYDKMLVWMRLYPKAVHKLLKLASEYNKKFCEAQEEIVGKCKIFWMGDHIASMVGKEQFNEFVLPYLNLLFKKYKGALRIWHNEGKCSHILERIDEIDAEVWHFGVSDDPALCKDNTHFCLMGNLSATGVTLKGTPKEVEESSKEVIHKAGRGGGLWLSIAGGMAPGTPFENIEAMLQACEKYGRYPIKHIAGALS